MTEPSTLEQRYQAVKGRVSAACALHSRAESDVTLIVVSKFHPASLVLDLMALGQRDFGENKDQEASAKAAAVAEAMAADTALADTALELPNWHFVGQLQSNKVKSVLRYASTIHSLDRPSLLGALAKELGKDADSRTRSDIGVFIELNLTDDRGRGGIHPDDLPAFADTVLEVPGLNLLGVMGVASLEGREEYDFEKILQASVQLQKQSATAKFISAGMSNDFEIALGFGATHLRVGTAITGPRAHLT